jgi:hypothetical protein
MPTDIKLKNSVTATNAPTSLQQGEVAINITDKKVWVGNAATTPVLLLGSGADGTFTNLTVSGVASFADGTVSLPSITNIGDTNTGIFFPAADTIAFTEGGTESMRIDASGNVGIGVTAPAVRLDLLASGSGDIVKFGVPASSRIINFYRDSANFAITDASGIAGNGMYGITTTNNLAFLTNSSERMRIDSSGNVGIGTSSPSTKFEVSASAATPIICRSSTATSYVQLTNSGGTTYIGSTSNDMQFLTGAAGTERMRIDSSGNVGIGTSSPTAFSGYTVLDVFNTTNGGAILARGSDVTTAIFGDDTAAAGIVETRTNHPLLFRTNTIERMRITSDGNLLIGSTASIYRLSALVASGADRALVQAGVSGITNGFTVNYVNSNTSMAYRFTSLVTTASAANAFLDSGDDNRLYRSTSSLRYKKDIESIKQSNSDAVLNLRPVWYRSKADNDNSDWSWYGLIAEEVAKVEPRLVHWSYLDSDYDVTEENGSLKKTLKADAKLIPDGVQYERVTVLLLDVVKRQEKAIQEQQALIENLTTRLNALEGK